MSIDGKQLAAEILEEARSQGGEGKTIRVITVSPTPATLSYLRIKTRSALQAGMTLEVIELPVTATTQEVVDQVQNGNRDAVIVQLPLPEHLDTEAILSAIPLEKDADVLSNSARNAGLLIPPVAAAVEEILVRGGVSITDAAVVVVGKGRLVGEPVAARLTALGANVQTYDEHSFSPDVLGSADIVVSGAGVPHLITPSMLRPGVALIDAGTSEQGGVLQGDIDPSCADLASLYTPVPGGVGPVAVACLMRNVAQLPKAEIAVH
jgi:5,10-methylene-tetrahydrofolate dehydrogenase/methenyl tetrahydrofolate cyclohydrolase